MGDSGCVVVGAGAAGAGTALVCASVGMATSTASEKNKYERRVVTVLVSGVSIASIETRQIAVNANGRSRDRQTGGLDLLLEQCVPEKRVPEKRVPETSQTAN